tara:strand:- start:1572 stop:1874 length:303 start_codon:yes stop_codon:yes gene_type:complete
MGSRPSAPVTYRPTPTAPTIYQSVIPEADFQNLSGYIDDLKEQRAKKKKETEDLGFGDAAMRERQKSYLQQEQDAYKKSLPKNPITPGGGPSTGAQGFKP